MMRWMIWCMGVMISMSSVIGAGMFAEEFGHLKPGEFIEEVRAPNGAGRASLFRGKLPGEYESPLHYYIYFCETGPCRWISTPTSLFSEIGDLQFIDNRTLLFTGSTEIWTASYLIDMRSGSVTSLGGGRAEYLRSGKNAGLFLLHGTKGYATDDRGEPLGAYWVDMLVDRYGNIVEVVSNEREKNCYPLRFILPREKRYPHLRQSLKSRICVIQ